MPSASVYARLTILHVAIIASICCGSVTSRSARLIMRCLPATVRSSLRRVTMARSSLLDLHTQPTGSLSRCCTRRNHHPTKHDPPAPAAQDVSAPSAFQSPSTPTFTLINQRTANTIKQTAHASRGLTCRKTMIYCWKSESHRAFSLLIRGRASRSYETFERLAEEPCSKTSAHCTTAIRNSASTRY